MKHLMKLLSLLLFTISLTTTLKAQLYTEYFLLPDTFYNSMEPTATIGAGNGSVLVTGYYQKTKEGENKIYYIPFICKFNSAGALEWFYDYNHLGQSHPKLQLRPVAITTTYPSQDIVVAGDVLNEEGEHQQAFAIKVNTNGHHQYTKFYNCIENREDDFLIDCVSFKVTSLVSDLQEGVVLAGHFKFSEEGNRFGIIVKIDQWGEFVPGMRKTFVNPSYESCEVVAISRMIGDQYAVLLSSTEPASPTSWTVSPDVVRVNNQFQTLWSKSLYRDEILDSYVPTGLKITSEQHIMISGHMGPKIYLSKLDGSNGNEWWTQSYTYTDMENNPGLSSYPPIFSIDYLDNLYFGQLTVQTSDEGSNFSTRVLKASPAGNIIWSKRYGLIDENPFFKNLCLANNSPYTYPAQDLILIGKKNKSVESILYNGGWKVRARIDDGSTDCNHATLDIEQEFIPFSDKDFDLSFIHILPTLSYHGVEKYQPDITLEKCGSLFFSEADNHHNTTVSVKKITENDLFVFPNPNHGSFTINIKHTDKNLPSEIIIYDIAGRIINQINLPSGSDEIKFSNLSKGTYLLRWTQGTETAVKKVVVQ